MKCCSKTPPQLRSEQEVTIQPLTSPGPQTKHQDQVQDREGGGVQGQWCPPPPHLVMSDGLTVCRHNREAPAC